MSAADLVSPLVSVITPVYNGGRYLPECIDSVRHQTYQDLEYIVFGNANTADSYEIALEYARKAKRIRVYRNTTLISAAANHNNAVRKISPQSRYYKFVHADDDGCWDYHRQVLATLELRPSRRQLALAGLERRLPSRLRSLLSRLRRRDEEG